MSTVVVILVLSIGFQLASVILVLISFRKQHRYFWLASLVVFLLMALRRIVTLSNCLFLDEYNASITAEFIALFISAVLFFVMLRYRKASFVVESSQQMLQQEKTISNIAVKLSRFDQLDHAVLESLEEFCAGFNLRRASIILGTKHGEFTVYSSENYGINNDIRHYNLDVGELYFNEIKKQFLPGELKQIDIHSQAGSFFKQLGIDHTIGLSGIYLFNVLDYGLFLSDRNETREVMRDIEEQGFVAVVQLFGDSIRVEQNKELLLLSEDKYRTIFDNAQVGMFRSNTKNQFIEVNKFLAKMLGYDSPQQVLENIKNIATDIYVDPSKRTEILMESKHAEGINHYKNEYKRKDGSVFIGHLILKTVKNKDGGILFLEGIVEDITSRIQKEEEIKTYQKQLQNLADNQYKQIEKERRQISRDLHDELGQYLSAILIGLIWIKKNAQGQGSGFKAKVLEMIRYTKSSIQQIRNIATRLHPRIIEDLGLPDAIEWFCRDFEKRSGISVHIGIDSEVESIPSETAINLYRIMQESFSNINKHSQANNVTVELNCSQDRILFTIADNGVGIVQSDIEASNGLGLAGIRERASMLHGTCKILPNQPHGTIIQVNLPCKHISND